MGQGSVSNTFNAGVLGVPWLFSTLLLLIALMLGMLISDMRHMQSDLARDETQHKEDMKQWATEIRLLQLHVQDTNAILLREGIKKPTDDAKGPTAPN